VDEPGPAHTGALPVCDVARAHQPLGHLWTGWNRRSHAGGVAEAEDTTPALRQCSTDTTVRLIFVTPWTIVRASRREPPVSPRSWLRDHYLLHVDPVTRTVRLLQAQQIEKAGQIRLAKRINNLVFGSARDARI